jgi:quercetin dioxygenase-like cupin family protein
MGTSTDSDGDFKAGEVVSPESMVEYQPGAIVSRTVVSKPTGTITLFAFDKGQGLSEHSAPFDAIVFALDGTVDVTISGKPFKVEKGQALMMPANKPHSVCAPDRVKMMLLMVKS